jgi:hypothetical protein
MTQPEDLALDLSQSIFSGFDPKSCIVLNELGVPLFDLEQTIGILESYILNLEKQGGLASAAARQSARADLTTLLSLLLKENNFKEMTASRILCIDAWSETIRTVLTQCYNSLWEVISQTKLFELLGTLLRKVSEPGVSNEIVGRVSDLVLAFVIKIRERFESQMNIQMSLDTPDSLEYEYGVPTDYLQQFILKGIIDCVLTPGLPASARGNFESSLLCYLLYAQPKGQRSKLAIGNFRVLQGYGEKVLATICKDASDGEEIWKVVALACLDVIFVLAEWSRSTTGSSSNYVLDFMIKKNYVSYFIGSLKKKYDGLLQQIILTDDGRAFL